MIRRVKRAQDGSRRRLSGAIVHGSLVDLLRSLPLIGIGDLIGALGLLLEGHRDVERKLANVRHSLDLHLNGIGQRRVGWRVQLFLQPVLGTDGAQIFGA